MAARREHGTGRLRVAPVDLESLATRIGRAAAAPRPAPVGRGYLASKRLLDLLIGGMALVLTAPLMAVIAVGIRLQSPGPALFRQQRVVQGGRVITFYKFRTMYRDARERFPELYAYSYTAEQFSQLHYKGGVDPRNTPFGRRIRTLTLDELPNLLNVVLGQVSLVGPRPELPQYVGYYTDEQLLKFTVPAGITGLAQVSGRNELSVQEQIGADLEYVRRRSASYDLRLLVRTVAAVLGRVGAT